MNTKPGSQSIYTIPKFYIYAGTKGVSGEFSWNGHSANTDDDERAEYVVQEPFSVHFSYSLFGAKLVLPRLVNKEGEWSNNGADGAAGAEEYAQIKHLPGGNNDALVEKLYCYEIPDLRMNKDKYNDKFTPRIKWSKQYWSTIWQGGRVSTANLFATNYFYCEGIRINCALISVCIRSFLGNFMRKINFRGHTTGVVSTKCLRTSGWEWASLLAVRQERSVAPFSLWANVV